MYYITYFVGFLFVQCYSATAPDLSDENTPLFLTPFIEQNKLEDGRKLAEVKNLDSQGSVKSYSGLLTVDKEHGSNIFFWYFPSERKADKVPLLLWQNGFSTASSYGVYLQMGPYDLLKTKDVQPRIESWQKYYHVVHFDNPVGVGYSFTESEEGYSKNLEESSDNLLKALTQFLKLFPELADREVYITGLSLAGKYASALAHKIHSTKQSINLKGIYLGNPLLDVVRQAKYSEYLYQLGFVDKNQKDKLIQMEAQAEKDYQNKDYVKFFQDINYEVFDDHSYIVNITGIDSVYNYNYPYIDPTHYFDFISREDVRKALHVGNVTFNDGVKAMSIFLDGFVFPVNNWLEDMIEDVDMTFYAGQFDLIIPYQTLVEVLTSLKWSGKDGYKAARRVKLMDNNNYVWGYKRNYKRLTDVMVRHASHSAVTDKPAYILSLLKQITHYDRF